MGAIDFLNDLGFWARLYGGLTGLVVVATLIAPAPGAQRSVAYLALTWVIYNSVRPHHPALDLSLLLAWMDLGGMLVGLSAIRVGRRARAALWTLVYIGLFALQMASHVLVQWINPDKGFYYYLWMNLIYVGHLLTLAVTALRTAPRPLLRPLLRRGALSVEG